MSIYNIENCISLDFGEACEEDIFEVQPPPLFKDI